MIHPRICQIQSTHHKMPGKLTWIIGYYPWIIAFRDKKWKNSDRNRFWSASIEMTRKCRQTAISDLSLEIPPIVTRRLERRRHHPSWLWCDDWASRNPVWALLRKVLIVKDDNFSFEQVVCRAHFHDIACLNDFTPNPHIPSPPWLEIWGREICSRQDHSTPSTNVKCNGSISRFNLGCTEIYGCSILFRTVTQNPITQIRMTRAKC